MRAGRRVGVRIHHIIEFPYSGPDIPANYIALSIRPHQQLSDLWGTQFKKRDQDLIETARTEASEKLGPSTVD